MGQDVKDRRVIFDIRLCVVITSLETGAFMAIIACIDMLMVTRNPEKSRRKSTQGAVAILRHKKSKVVSLKMQIQRSLFCGKLGKRD